MTKEQEQQYVKSDGQFCPFCQGDQIDRVRGYEKRFGFVQLERQLSCCECDKEWTEIYPLTEIKEGWEDGGNLVNPD